jgi:hypothetical protein
MSFQRVFEQQLVSAAGRSFARRRILRVPRRGALLGLFALTATGVTLAATQPWSPQLGDPAYEQDAPRTAGSGPPAGQLDQLGVLRRPQSDFDRDPAVAEGLRYMSASVSDGVRVAYIRHLADSAPGRAVVLIPLEHYRLPSTPHRRLPAIADALCVYYPEPVADGGAKACWTTEDVMQGRALAGLGHHVFGLVPDRVATVRIELGAGRVVETAVKDNFFTLVAPGRTRKIIWLSATGEVL